MNDINQLKKVTNELTIKNERINERVKSNRFQDWTIPYLRIRDFYGNRNGYGIDRNY